MKNKKILAGVMMGAVLAVGAMGLAACGEKPKDPTTPSHTHAYSAPYYTIKNEDGQEKVYTYTKCDCGAETEYTLVENAVIAKPANAQQVLDSDINGKTVVFSGEFNDILSLRPSKETSKIYKVNTASQTTEEWYTLGDEVTTEINQATSYHYLRDVKNVVFAATNESKFNNLFYTESIHVDKDIITNKWTLNTSLYDAVKEIPITEGFSYFAHVNIENVHMTRMNFSGKNGRFVVHIYEPNKQTPVNVKNFTISNCSFTTTEEAQQKVLENTYVSAAICITPGGSKNRLENIVIKDNVISGHAQGVALLNFNNVTIEGNTISKTGHNAVALQTVDASVASPKSASAGNIIIKNNTIFNIGREVTGERAIRFGVLKNANVLIEENNFKNCAEDRTSKGQGIQLLATQSITNTTIDFKNNIYNDEAMENKTHTEDVPVGSNFTIKISN